MSRNWREYNNKLVKRREFYLLADFIDYWNEELEEMNKNKRGSPFEYPQSFIGFCSVSEDFFQPTIQRIKGYYKEIISVHIWIKISRLYYLMEKIRATEFELKQLALTESESEGVIAAIDATGMRVTNRGEWMREKWKKKRGWIKVHIIVPTTTRTTSTT